MPVSKLRAMGPIIISGLLWPMSLLLTALGRIGDVQAAQGAGETIKLLINFARIVPWPVWLLFAFLFFGLSVYLSIRDAGAGVVAREETKKLKADLALAKNTILNLRDDIDQARLDQNEIIEERLKKFASLDASLNNANAHIGHLFGEIERVRAQNSDVVWSMVFGETDKYNAKIEILRMTLITLIEVLKEKKNIEVPGASDLDGGWPK